MNRSKTLKIELDTNERFDLDLPGDRTNTSCRGIVRVQVRSIRLHTWLDWLVDPDLLTVEGRRYRHDGTLFDLHVRASLERFELPAEWLAVLEDLEQR